MVRNVQKRVYYHETFDVCDGLPDLLHRFPLRALLVARPGERVVLGYGNGPPAELPLLNRLGFGPRPEDLIFVNQHGDVIDGDNDIEGAIVLPFSGTTRRARRFAERHGAAFQAPSRDVCMNANSKGYFQMIVNDEDASYRRKAPQDRLGPGGKLMEREVLVLSLDLTGRHPVKMIAKGDHSASGLQQVVIEPGATPDLSGLPEQLVLQEWVEHDYSPSLQCVIHKDRSVRQLSTTVQILDGNKHVGNVCPSGLPDGVVAQMRAKGDVVCRRLAEAGFWGICGVDFLVRESDGTVLANEVNARIPAPWYPWNASCRRFGEPLPFRMKSVALRDGATIDDVEDAVGARLFDPRTRSGFVPFCFVPEHGFVYGVTFSTSVGNIEALSRRVDESLAALAP